MWTGYASRWGSLIVVPVDILFVVVIRVEMNLHIFWRFRDFSEPSAPQILGGHRAGRSRWATTTFYLRSLECRFGGRDGYNPYLNYIVLSSLIMLHDRGPRTSQGSEPGCP